MNWWELLGEEEKAGPGAKTTTWPEYFGGGAPYPVESYLTSGTRPTGIPGIELDKETEELIKDAVMFAAPIKIAPLKAAFAKKWGSRSAREYAYRLEKLIPEWLQKEERASLHPVTKKGLQRLEMEISPETAATGKTTGFQASMGHYAPKEFEKLAKETPLMSKLAEKAFYGPQPSAGETMRVGAHETAHIWENLLREMHPVLMKEFPRNTIQTEALAQAFADRFMTGSKYYMPPKTSKSWQYLQEHPEIRDMVEKYINKTPEQIWQEGALATETKQAVLGKPMHGIAKEEIAPEVRRIHQDKLLNLGKAGSEEAKKHLSILSDEDLQALAKANRLPMSKDRAKLEETILHYADRAAMNVLHGPTLAKEEILTGSRDPYSGVSETLLGFGKNPKGYYGQKYKYNLPVRVEWPDGMIHFDEIKGLNKSHALERAKRNWEGAKITPVGQ